MVNPGNAPQEYEFEGNGLHITVMRGTLHSIGSDHWDPDVSSAQKDMFHTHSGHELFYAKEGSVLLCFEDELFSLPQGQLAIVPPGKSHHAVFSDCRDRKHVFNYMLQQQRSSHTTRTLDRLHRSGEFRCFPPDTQTGQLAQLLSDALSRGDHSLCGLYMLALLLNCARCCALTAPAENQPPENTAGRLYKIDQAIFFHHTGKLPLKSLAQELHLSPRQLSRIIQKHYGVSYRAKNKQLRMQSAARRLQKGEEISQVAVAEGYSSLSAFYTAFRKTFGITPAKYKALHQKQLLPESPKHNKTNRSP